MPPSRARWYWKTFPGVPNSATRFLTQLCTGSAQSVSQDHGRGEVQRSRARSHGREIGRYRTQSERGRLRWDIARTSSQQNDRGCNALSTGPGLKEQPRASDWSRPTPKLAGTDRSFAVPAQNRSEASLARARRRRASPHRTPSQLDAMTCRKAVAQFASTKITGAKAPARVRRT